MVDPSCSLQVNAISTIIVTALCVFCVCVCAQVIGHNFHEVWGDARGWAAKHAVPGADRGEGKAFSASHSDFL